MSDRNIFSLLNKECDSSSNRRWVGISLFRIKYWGKKSNIWCSSCCVYHLKFTLFAFLCGSVLCGQIQVPVSRGLQQFLAAARCLCDTFSGVLMLLSRLTAEQAAEASPLPGDGNGWLDGDSRGGGGRRQEEGVRGGGEDGRGKMLLWGGVSYPRPMAAPLLRWMKAPRPAVVAVTNLLRFSARLEARGRGSPSRPHQHHQHHPTTSFPSCLPQHSQRLHPNFQRS